MPNASTSPPSTRATTSASEMSRSAADKTRGEFTRSRSRMCGGQGIPRDEQEARGAEALALYGAGERLEGRLGAAAIVRFAGRGCQAQQHVGGPRVRARQQVVEHGFHAVVEGSS